jgi:hypothetical protein
VLDLAGDQTMVTVCRIKEAEVDVVSPFGEVSVNVLLVIMEVGEFLVK